MPKILLLIGLLITCGASAPRTDEIWGSRRQRETWRRVTDVIPGDPIRIRYHLVTDEWKSTRFAEWPDEWDKWVSRTKAQRIR